MRFEIKEKRLQEIIEKGGKVCSKCGIKKPLNRFLFEKKWHKHRAECKDCRRIRKGQKSIAESIIYRKQIFIAKRNEEVKQDLKECIVCKKLKPLSGFRGEKRNKNWFNRQCKQCEKIKYNKQKRRIELTEEEQQRRKEERERRKRERIERQNQKERERYWNDPEYRKQRLQYSREHHQSDRSKMLARKHKREALMINQHDGTATTKEIKRILEERKTCPYCGDPIGKPEIDHMDPISKGGLHSISNIIGCCHKCNSNKHTKSFIEWISFIKEERRDYVIKLYERKHGARPEQKSLSFKYAA